ncbi:MAG: LysR substrate-binding domain-containing protein, partial [Pseudomonadota bacterium]
VGADIKADAHDLLQYALMGMSYARNGLGIAALPDYITRDADDLVQILPEEASDPITVYFVYPEELRHSQRVLAFRDFVLRELESFTKRSVAA